MKKLLLYYFTVCCLLSCNGKISPLEEYDNIISGSNRMVIRFNANPNFNLPPVVKVINMSSQLDELRDLMNKSTPNAPCIYYDGTMTFFNDAKETGHLEFSINPECPAFYFHVGDTTAVYQMTPFCGIFLQGIREGGSSGVKIPVSNNPLGL